MTSRYPYDEEDDSMPSNRRPHWDVAQVCSRGHLITPYALSTPQRVVTFCPHCGAKTLMACPECHAAIHGHLHFPDVMVPPARYAVPNFCYQCGKPYPWLAEKLQAARDFAAEVEGLQDAERVTLATSYQEVTQDSPRTAVAVMRIKRIVKTLPAAAQALAYQFAVDVASETAVKLIRGE